jgi:upstream activation factor subunit UAF30
MVKAKKTETTTATTSKVEVAPTNDTTPVKATRKSTTKKSTVDVVETQPPVPTPPAPPATDEVDNTETVLTDVFSEFMSKLQSLASQINALKGEFRTLEKKSVRELKTAQKAQQKRRRKNTNRSPSGFVKPTLITNELADFLKKPHGTEMARTEVTKEINSYIREHQLQDKTNGRKIIPDAQLTKLLKIGTGEELTYFNLQRYMSPHFAKATPKDTVATK